MSKTILDFFDQTVESYRDKIAVGDSEREITYKELQDQAKIIGSSLAQQGYKRQPIALFMKRSINVTGAMLGTLYSGNFYVVLDCDSPIDRLSKILETLSPAAIVYDNELQDKVDKLDVNSYKVSYQNILESPIDEALLESVRLQMLSTDPAYSIFTSGSTGNPKGALLTHSNVISYMDWFITTFNIDAQTVFGSQTPPYFSMSVTDMFASFFTGAGYQLIPKEYFAFPVRAVEFMNQRQVNTIYWVPTAMGIVAKMDLFKYVKPKHLENVFFAGEVMPVKYLNYWRKHFPDVRFTNLFGPTETTDICAYYVVNREFSETETLPIGVPCSNCRLFVLNEEGMEAVNGEEGELYASGPFIAKGYYKNKEKTDEAFIQNPLHNDYHEIVYKTGDLVRQNDKGEFEYIGRKDFQIKHMGYRIETGEIEAAFGALDHIELTVCIYDDQNDKLILAYEGKEDMINILRETAEESLPEYMRPHDYKAFDNFPKNQNGKIDRKELKNIIIG